MWLVLEERPNCARASSEYARLWLGADKPACVAPLLFFDRAFACAASCGYVMHVLGHKMASTDKRAPRDLVLCCSYTARRGGDDSALAASEASFSLVLLLPLPARV
jgi:hypothetical protein